MSNFTDFEILRHEPGIHLRYVTQAEKLGHPDLLILPGTKSTLNDLREIQARGFESVIRNYFENGGVLLGVCGGFQMLGKTITDAQGLESHAAQTKGFGFFDMHTEFVPEKVLNRKSHKIEFVLDGLPVSGTVDVYEIHMGRSRWAESYQPFGDAGAVHSSGRILGTYDHGLFDHPDFRQSFFSALAKRSHKKWQPGASIVTTDLKEAHYQRLARLLRDHLDLPFLEKRMGLSLVSKLDQPVG